MTGPWSRTLKTAAAGYEFAMEAWKRVAAVGVTNLGSGGMHSGEEQVRTQGNEQNPLVGTVGLLA